MPKIYLVAEHGRPKEILEAWRKEFLDGLRAYQKFADELGATTTYGFPFERPSGFVFPRGVAPEGWTKPNNKGFSRPKKANTEMQAQIGALPFPEHPDQMIAREFGLPISMDYVRGGSRGGSLLTSGGMHTFSFCWPARADGELSNVIMTVPDYDVAAQGHDTVTWKPEGTEPHIPDGFRQVSEAEVDLLFAESKVKREKYKAVCKEMELMLDVHTPSDLFQAVQSCMSQFGRSLIVDLDAGDDGMTLAVRYENEFLNVHPPLRKALWRLAPQLVKCEIPEWDENHHSSGRIIWRHGEAPFLDMTSLEKDWLYEREIDADMLMDMDFEPEAASKEAAPAPE